MKSRNGAPCSVSCYFPMPFNKKAKIEIVNENELPFIFILILIMKCIKKH